MARNAEFEDPFVALHWLRWIQLMGERLYMMFMLLGVLTVLYLVPWQWLPPPPHDEDHGDSDSTVL